MNLLDWLLVAVAVGYAISGYWQGFICGAFATVGLLIGGAIGIWLAPQIFASAVSSVWVSLGAILVVLVCASLGQAVLHIAGSRIRDRIRWQPVRALDAVGGALLSAAAVLVVAWAIGVAASGSRLPVVGEQVRGSTVLAEVDEAMPDGADGVLQAFNDVVGASAFPRYLEPFAPERIVQVPAPSSRIARDPQVRDARLSVVKIRGANRCGPGIEGSGFLYSANRVMTNAHVVAGVDNPSVGVGDQQVRGRVVYYNPDLDVAVLAVAGLDRPFLRFDRNGAARQPGAVLGYPNDGPYVVQPARIRSEQRLRSADIYGNGTVVREVFAVRSRVRPGNSGGPLVSRDGEVLGLVFAASVTDSATGYALTADQVAASAAQGLSAVRRVGTGACV